MSKTCLDCQSCLCRLTITPTNSQQFRHKSPAVTKRLNSSIQFGRVRCKQFMWMKDNGDDFEYESLDLLMKRPQAAKLKRAETCLHYEVL